MRDAVLAALFLVLQAYAELTYASFLLVFIGLVVVWRLVAASFSRWVVSRTAGWLTARFALVGVLFGVGIAPVLANMLPDLRSEGDFFTSGGGFADVFSADLAGYAVPTQLHPLFGGVVRGWADDVSLQADGRDFAVNKGQHIYIGCVALMLVAAAVWHGRRRAGSWFWATAALLFFLLTLGPSLRIAGADTGIPLPFRLVEQLPFFKGNRYPSRYSVMLLASLAPLVALGARWLLVGAGRLRRGSRDFQSPRPLSGLFRGDSCRAALRASLPAAASFKSWECACALRYRRGRAGRFHLVGVAFGLAQRCACSRQAGCPDHAAALVSEQPR